jgi:hypothetical protein
MSLYRGKHPGIPFFRASIEKALKGAAKGEQKRVSIDAVCAILVLL